MTFMEYFALKSLTTEEFAESICLMFDKNLINKDKDSFLQEILWDKYSDFLSLIS